MERAANENVSRDNSDTPLKYKALHASELAASTADPTARAPRRSRLAIVPETRLACTTPAITFEIARNSPLTFFRRADDLVERLRDEEDAAQPEDPGRDPALGNIHFLPLRERRSNGLSAFERELLALLPRLRRFARALAHDAADADDLLQVALERALKGRHLWRPGTRLDAWTMRIVRNCWIDEARSRIRRARTFAPEGEIETIGDDGQFDIERRVELDKVDRAMSTLPREQREAIALVLVEGLAYREAAEMLQIPMGTLTSRVTRGRHALVQMFEAP